MVMGTADGMLTFAAGLYRDGMMCILDVHVAMLCSSHRSSNWGAPLSNLRLEEKVTDNSTQLDIRY